MRSLIGFNVDQSTVKNWPRFVSHLDKTRPAWCLTFGVDSANALRKAGVQNVAVRIFNGEGSVAGKMNANDLMRRFQNVADNGHFCELTNETGLQTTWLKTVLPTMLARGFKVTAPALSSGTPEQTDYAGIRGLVEIAAQYPDTFRFSVHEYLPYVPFNVLARYWSPSMPLPAQPWYYNGRVESMLYPYCDQWGLPRPRYIVPELGIAAENGAQNAPRVSNGYPGPNGWYSIAGWLEACYPNASAAQTYARMISYLARVLYGRPESGCDGLCIYCLGADWNRPKGSQDDWSGFDLERDPEPFYTEFEAFAMSSTPTLPAPVWADYTLTVSPGASVNLRASPNADKTTAVITVIPEGEYGVLKDTAFPPTRANDFDWSHVVYGNGLNGYIASSLPSVTLVAGAPQTVAISRTDWDTITSTVNKYQPKP